MSIVYFIETEVDGETYWYCELPPTIMGWSSYGGFSYSGKEGLTKNPLHAEAYKTYDEAEKVRRMLVCGEHYKTTEHEFVK